jgi:hypothetical protein
MAEIFITGIFVFVAESFSVIRFSSALIHTLLQRVRRLFGTFVVPRMRITPPLHRARRRGSRCILNSV